MGAAAGPGGVSCCGGRPWSHSLSSMNIRKPPAAPPVLRRNKRRQETAREYTCSVPPERSAVALPPTFSYAQARAAGYTKHAIYQLRDSGVIEPLSRGLYRLTSAEVFDLDLLEIAHKAPQATLCLISALSRHGLTDEIPARTDIALPRQTRPPAVATPVRWHQFARESFDVGRMPVQLAANTQIGLYSAERSIVDAFRLRGREGDQLAHEALKRWLRKRNQPATLLRLARHFPRTVTPIREALELLL